MIAPWSAEQKSEIAMVKAHRGFAEQGNEEFCKQTLITTLNDLSEFVTQSCVSMYYNLWNIRKARSHYFSHCSSNQGTFS
jgi:hypothetical protein